MLKKLSVLLALATLCTNMGIVSFADTDTEETVLIESNFQSCNLGTYTKENQTDGENDLRNGIVMVDDSDLSAGYTIKNGDVYEGISEADIVDDNGTRVLRLNTFLNTYTMTDDLTEEDANYPVVKSTEKLPQNSKIRIDMELKMSPRVSFHMHHSKPNDPAFRIWRLENGNSTSSKIKVLSNTDTLKTAACNEYNMHTAIIDTKTGHMKIYLNGEFIWETTDSVKGRVPEGDRELFLRQISLNDASVKPTPTYNAEDSTKIEDVTNPQYVYVKSLKVTTFKDIEVLSVSPENGSKLITPEKAVFNFSSKVNSVASATVTPWGKEAIDVRELLVVEGKTVTVPYDFEDDVMYTVALTGVSDGVSSVDAATTFTAESWRFSNIRKSPVSASTSEDIIYFINEDFEASDDINLILPENTKSGWHVDNRENVAVTELSDGTKALKLSAGATFSVKYDKSLKLLDNTTTLSYDVYINEGTKNFNVDRDDYSGSVKNLPVATWNNGYYNNAAEPVEMSAGEWHNIMITISDTEGTTIYIDGIKALNIARKPEYTGLSETSFFRFKVRGGDVLIDNFKLYLNKTRTVLKDIYPKFDATDVSVSEVMEFTYSNAIGDVSGATLIVKPNDTNAPIILTNGNGMTVSGDGNKVKVMLTDALLENSAYAFEFSGISDTADTAIEAVRTRFSTVYDSAWEIKDFEGHTEGATKKYSVKVKNETDTEGACMAVAVYDEKGCLKEAVFSEPAESGKDWTELKVNVNYKEGNTYRVFIWDSKDSMNMISSIISD